MGETSEAHRETVNLDDLVRWVERLRSMAAADRREGHYGTAEMLTAEAGLLAAAIEEIATLCSAVTYARATTRTLMRPLPVTLADVPALSTVRCELHDAKDEDAVYLTVYWGDSLIERRKLGTRAEVNRHALMEQARPQ